MSDFLRACLRRFGWELRRIAPPSKDPSLSFSDLTIEEREILDAALPFSMTSAERIAQVILGVKHLVQHRIAGAIVECGVWRGGSMMAAARMLRLLGDTSRDLYLYDTFEGMPPPAANDRRFDGEPAAKLFQKESAKEAGHWCRASVESVQRTLAETGYPLDRIHLVRGRVEETIPNIIPTRIALLRLDTDWYQSTRHELLHLYPRLEQWGVMIIDDYGWWQGARAAVDEYIGELPHPVFLHRIDYTGRLVIKPTGREIASS